jgi:4-amino-4-deoxy-L-arabinose transferase-like glycosyltransferase
MIQNKKIFLALLIVIFAIGVFLRFYKISFYPAGFQMDEASKGYTAYSLLKTGKDDNNNFLPLNIDMFGDNSPAGYHYFAVLPVAIFGLSEYAVRFPGALFGSLSVLAFYFLVSVIFKDKKTALLSAFLLAISPWHINMSRASSESLVALFFIILGFSFIIFSLKTQAIKHVVSGAFFLAISFLFYQSPRLFIPLFFLTLLIFLFWVWKVKINARYKKGLVFSFIFLLLFVFVLFFIIPGGTGRFTQVNIFNSLQTKLVVDEQIRSEGVLGTNVFISRLFHNKLIGYTQTYFYNYLEYFSWNFLFVKGLPPMYQIPGMGVLYFVELPFVLLGLFALLINKNQIFKIPLLWLVVAPTAAAIAVDTNNLQRSLVMYPMLEIIAAFGIIYFFTNVIKCRRKFWLVITVLLFLFNFSYFFHQYFVLSKVFEPWYRNNGFPQMISLIKKDYNGYGRIITTKSQGGYPLFQFYLKFDPVKYQKKGSPKDKSYKGFGKFIFSPANCPFSSKDPLLPKKGKVIFVEDGSCVETPLLHKVPFTYVLRADGTRAFRVVYVNDDSLFNATNP